MPITIKPVGGYKLQTAVLFCVYIRILSTEVTTEKQLAHFYSWRKIILKQALRTVSRVLENIWYLMATM